MSIGLDVSSYVAQGNAFKVIPCRILPTADPTGLMPVINSGSPNNEGVNWLRGLSTPVVPFRAEPHRSWFNTTNLRLWYTTGRDAYGQLSSTGACAYRIGSGGMADRIGRNFDAFFFPGMTITGGGQGAPVSVETAICPCGNELTGGAIPSYPGGFDITPTETGNAGWFLSDGVTFNSQLTDVLGWTITLSNSLLPDVTVPGGTSPDVRSRIFPKGYRTRILGAGLSITQYTGTSLIIDDPSLDVINNVQIRLDSGESYGSGGTSGSKGTVVFTLHGLKPDPISQFNADLGTITRTYIGQAYYDGSAVYHSKIAID